MKKEAYIYLRKNLAGTFRLWISRASLWECVLFVLFGGLDHLVTTDVMTSGMNGKQLAEVLRSKRPGIKVLFMSGYAHDALSTQGMLEPGVAMMHKPFRTVALTCQVRQVLDSGA